MTPTGRSIDLEKIRKKLEEAKTLEEKRLIIEELRDYRQYLREKLGRRESTILGLLIATIVTVPLQALTLTPKVVTMVLPLIYAAALVYAGYLKNMCETLEEKIRGLYDITLDPPMSEKHEMKDRTCDLAFWTMLVITIISIIIALIKLGVIP